METNTSLHAGYRERWNIRHVGFSWFRLLSLESFRSQPGNGHQQTSDSQAKDQRTAGHVHSNNVMKNRKQSLRSFAQEL